MAVVTVDCNTRPNRRGGWLCWSGICPRCGVRLPDQAIDSSRPNAAVQVCEVNFRFRLKAGLQLPELPTRNQSSAFASRSVRSNAENRASSPARRPPLSYACDAKAAIGAGRQAPINPNWAESVQMTPDDALDQHTDLRVSLPVAQNPGPAPGWPSAHGKTCAVPGQ